MTSLWRNFSGTVFANSNWSYLFLLTKFIEECNRFNNMYGALSALHVSLNIASMRTVRRWLKKKQWPPNYSPNLNKLTVKISCPRSNARRFLKPSSEAQYSFWMKKRSERRKHCSLALVRRAKNFRTVVDSLTRAQNGQNLISWRWSLPLPTNPVWWKSMHAISSYRGNRPTNKHPQTNPQTGPLRRS